MYYKLNQEKVEIIKNIVNFLKLSKNFIIFNYSGSDVENFSSLRQKLYANKCLLKVFKNNLLKIAFENCGYAKESQKMLIGQNAIIFSFSNGFSSFREIYDYKKINKKTEIKFGMFNNKIINSEKIIEIAQIPSFDDLLIKFCSNLLFPIQKFLFSIKNIISKKEGE